MTFFLLRLEIQYLIEQWHRVITIRRGMRSNGKFKHILDFIV